MSLPHNQLESLIESLEELNLAVSKAKTILDSSEKPNTQVIDSIEQYQEICGKQLEFAYSASSAIQRNKAEDAIRYINLIESLSDLVKSDVASYLPETPQLNLAFS